MLRPARLVGPMSGSLAFWFSYGRLRLGGRVEARENLGA
jgi:hypothetical protein